MRVTWFLVPQLSPALFFENKQSATNGSGLKESPTLSSIDAKDSPTFSVVGENESLMNSAKNDQAMSPVTAPMAFVERRQLEYRCQREGDASYFIAKSLEDKKHWETADYKCVEQQAPETTNPLQQAPGGGYIIHGAPLQRGPNGGYIIQDPDNVDLSKFNVDPDTGLYVLPAVNAEGKPVSAVSSADYQRQLQEEFLKKHPGLAHHFGQQAINMVGSPVALPPPHGQGSPQNIGQHNMVPAPPGPPGFQPGAHTSFMETPTEQSIPVGVKQHHIQSATRTSFRGSLPSRVSEGEKSL